MHRHVAHSEMATHLPIHSVRRPFWHAVPPVSIKPRLAVAAKASGVVGAEGMPGALAVAVFTGFPVGAIVSEDLIFRTHVVLQSYHIPPSTQGWHVTRLGVIRKDFSFQRSDRNIWL